MAEDHVQHRKREPRSTHASHTVGKINKDKNMDIFFFVESKNIFYVCNLEQQQHIGSVRRKNEPLSCSICGGAAHGYNFDAITCESCKAFFRRNALKPLVS